MFGFVKGVRKRPLPLDPGLGNIAARFALEGEKEIEALFDIGPVERESRIVAEQRKASSRNGQETLARLGREGARGIGFNKLLQRGVPGNACFARSDVALDRLERLQSENIFGVDRVRIAAQNLDSRDAQGFRAEFKRRTRRRRSSLRLEISRPISSARASAR